jgi:sodium transport system permease protein
MLNNIINITRKEIMDMVRDSKALRQTLLVPLLLGVFYAALNPVLGSLFSSRAEGELVIPVQGLEHAGAAFVDSFAQFDIRLQPFAGDMEAAIQRGEEPAGLIFPPGFAAAVSGEQAATLIVRTNSTAGGPFGGSISLSRLELALNAYNQSLTVERLQVRQVDPAILAPVTLDAQDLATAAQRAGATAALFLPMLVAIIAIQGGMFIAIDVTAGEKERGTLESLLVTPASDVEIFVGKLLAVFAVSAVPILLTLLGFWGGTRFLPDSMTNGAGVLPFMVVIQTAVAALPLVLLASVVLMIVSIRTKTFKDAQAAMSPVMFGIIIVAMGAAFLPPVSSLPFLIPAYGTSAVVGVLAAGGIMPDHALLFSSAGSLAATLVGIGIAMWLFNRERLLYSA